ncbi:MAG: hypothetical protein L3J23_06210 [Flavobacteriaceae bacterium]|nr:hypothetical protein [Flavobacteriaceae bacterium]
MKHSILYLLLFSGILFGCKSDKIKTLSNLSNTSLNDETKKKTTQVPKSLKEKLIEKRYNKLSDINELKDYSTGWFLLGERNNSNKEVYIIKCSERNGDLKIILSKYFDEALGDKKNVISDLIEIDEFTKSIPQEKINKIDIFSDILLNNKRTSDLIALAVYEEAEVMSEVYKVWRIDLETGKFEEITDLSGITVINEDF